jgi:membrane protease YdiL (CAAX protease family)
MANRKRSDSGDQAGRGNDVVTGIVTFMVAAVVTAYLFVTNADLKEKESYWLINNCLCLWVPLFTIQVVLRQEPAQFGMQRGDARFGFRTAAALWLGMLIVCLLLMYAGGSRIPYLHRIRHDFQHYYLYNNLSVTLAGVGQVNSFGGINWKALVYYELAMGFYMYCWEFFFRGFLLFGLMRTKLGVWGAVIIQAIPFTLLHWSYNPAASKPLPEVAGAFIAAIILGMLASRTKSFLYGYLAHYAVSVTFDFLVLAPFISRHVG